MMSLGETGVGDAGIHPCLALGLKLPTDRFWFQLLPLVGGQHTAGSHGRRRRRHAHRHRPMVGPAVLMLFDPPSRVTL